MTRQMTNCCRMQQTFGVTAQSFYNHQTTSNNQQRAFSKIMLEAVSVQVDIYPRIRLHQTRLRKALPHRARWRGASNPNPETGGLQHGSTDQHILCISTSCTHAITARQTANLPSDRQSNRIDCIASLGRRCNLLARPKKLLCNPQRRLQTSGSLATGAKRSVGKDLLWILCSTQIVQLQLDKRILELRIIVEQRELHRSRTASDASPLFQLFTNS